jgi:hypothetical protein
VEVDQREREQMRREIARLRSRQADKKAILTRLDVKKDERQIKGLLAEIAGLEGEIASIERKL